MTRASTVHLASWLAYALVTVLHLFALVVEAPGLQLGTQLVLMPLLIVVLLTGVVRYDVPSMLTALGLASTWVAAAVGPLLHDQARQTEILFYLITFVCYSIALWPLWWRQRDPFRMALAIPYGGVVIGLLLAFSTGAGDLLPLVVLYALALAVMSFLSAGGNGFTWSGGTLLLLSSSLLSMAWFLPGASLDTRSFWVALTYTAGQALLVAGIVRASRASVRRRTERSAGSTFVIVEN